jgi:hypothetical protein
MSEGVLVGPDAVAGHGKSGGRGLPPLWRGGGFAPVVHPDRLAILQLDDAYAPVEPPVSVVGGPLNYHHIIEVQSPTHLQGQFWEIPSTSGTS